MTDKFYSIAYVAHRAGHSLSAVERAARDLELRPSLTLNAIEYFSLNAVERIDAHIHEVNAMTKEAEKKNEATAAQGYRMFKARLDAIVSSNDKMSPDALRAAYRKAHNATADHDLDLVWSASAALRKREPNVRDFIERTLALAAVGRAPDNIN